VFDSRGPQAWRVPRRLGLIFLVAGALLGPGELLAKDAVLPMGTMALGELPREARATEAAIRAGGPFSYDKDGVVFANRERRLPAANKGYYREYTVMTPGAANRGARRIVCGGYEPAVPQACYYSADHYTSFRRIVK
jgi:ribonuclease T1